jgi:MFS family permease
MTETAVREARVSVRQWPGRFARLWTANVFSNLGDGLYQFALPLLALDLTRSPSLVSGVTLMLTLAWPVFGLHAGSIVDRFEHRNVLLGVGVLRMVTLGALTVALATETLTLPMLYVAALALGVGETLADTALVALVPSTVVRDRLDWANGRITAGQTVTNQFLGPPLAGGLLAIGSAVVTGVATGVYAVAAVVLGTLTRVAPAGSAAAGPADEAKAGWGVTEGFRYLWSHGTIRKLTLLTAGMNLWWAAWYGLFALHAVAPGPLGLQPPAYGAMLVAMAIGGIVGSLVAAPLSRRVGIKATLVLDFVGTTLLVGVPALTTNPWLVAAGNVVAGVGSAMWIVLVGSIRQRLTPAALLGRLYSASRLIGVGVLPIGAGLGGLAAEVVGIEAVFGFGAIVTLVLLAAFVATVREEELAAEAPPG